MWKITIKRILKFIYTPLIPFIFPVFWIIPLVHRLFIKSRTNSPQKVLLIAQNIIAVDHMRDISKILEENPDTILFITADWFPAREITADDLNLPATFYINIIKSLTICWDLIIFANHPWGFGIWFAPFIKKIYINHGIHTGKINNLLGEDGVYGPSRVLRPFKTPYYDCMFTSSNHEREQAISATPALLSKVYVAGSLKADKLLNLNRQRDSIRQRLQFRENDFVVHIISTWGPHSLFQTLGEDLLLRAVTLPSPYRFILSLHPRHDEFGDIKKRTRSKILDKFELLGLTINREMDWENFVIASDCAISDHSSLSLYYFLLNKPVAFTNVDSNQYIDNYIFSLLKKRFPIVNDSSDLEKCIEELHFGDWTRPIHEISDLILDYSGQAKKRHLEKINHILKY